MIQKIKKSEGGINKRIPQYKTTNMKLSRTPNRTGHRIKTRKKGNHRNLQEIQDENV
jgi:hypothetical protein